MLQGIFHKQVGEALSQEEARHLTVRLAEALEMAAGLRPSDGLLEQLTTREAAGALPLSAPGEKLTLSFSGGVADCIEREIPWQEFGDIGPLLGQAIGTSRLCSGKYVLGTNTIRATVIGAGCHSTQLSGSTVYSQNVQFPLKNIPVITQKAQRSQQEGNVFLRCRGSEAPLMHRFSKWLRKSPGCPSHLSMPGAGYGKGLGAGDGAAAGEECGNSVH